MKLWLIGMMGSGKTTTGRATAARLAVEFVDTDEKVEALTEMSIPQLWVERGEAAFRSLESEVVVQLAEGDAPAVIGTGGGVPLEPKNREAMGESGTVVWLKAAPVMLAARIGSVGRPLLVGDVDPATRLQGLLAERSASYAEAADHEIEVDRLDVSDVVDRLVELWPR